MLWLIIGLTICYFVHHERERQRTNLENRLLNVNNTVLSAYENGGDLQKTVEFIRLFTDNTTLTPLRITVYDKDGNMVADNPAATIELLESDGQIDPELAELMGDKNSHNVRDLDFDNGEVGMVSAKISDDGRIISLAALPYQGEVVDFLSIDPMVWVVVILLGLMTSVLAFWGVAAVCRNVYTLRDFATAIAEDRIPQDINEYDFSNDELGDVSRKLLNLYRDKIYAEQEKMHHERLLCINLSHELNTPVGIIKGYLDTVMSDENMDEATRRRFMQRMQENINRLVRLVSDVSMVMRLAENGETLDCSVVDFNSLCNRIGYDIVQGRLTGDMKFSYDIPADCKVKAHSSLLTNALLNLIYNAVRYSEGTEMRLDWLGERDGMHHFAFSDNGRGVSPEHLTRLFDLFYRVDAGRSRKSGGTGLGLPMVKRIINAMGGKISVENGPEGGLRFIFTLPVGRENPELSETA